MPAGAGRGIVPGSIVWASLEPVQIREQGGVRRAVVVVAGRRYLEIVDTLAVVVPVTTTDRGWPNHVVLSGQTGLPRTSRALTEQVRTLSRSRLGEATGVVSPACLAVIRVWVSDFLDLRP